MDIADFNNDLERDIAIANCGTNNIGFISNFVSNYILECR
jgi:hypothetical protein